MEEEDRTARATRLITIPTRFGSVRIRRWAASATSTLSSSVRYGWRRSTFTPPRRSSCTPSWRHPGATTEESTMTLTSLFFPPFLTAAEPLDLGCSPPRYTKQSTVEHTPTPFRMPIGEGALTTATMRLPPNRPGVTRAPFPSTAAEPSAVGRTAGAATTARNSLASNLPRRRTAFAWIQQRWPASVGVWGGCVFHQTTGHTLVFPQSPASCFERGEHRGCTSTCRFPSKIQSLLW